MCKELVRELQSFPDAEYGCSRCEFQKALNCREHLMKKAADAIEELSKRADEWEALAESWKKACEGLENRMPRWVSVTERLPEKHQWCLVVGENLYDMDFINSRGVWTMHDKPYAPIDYWMPLPEPPKEEA